MRISCAARQRPYGRLPPPTSRPLPSCVRSQGQKTGTEPAMQQATAEPDDSVAEPEVPSPAARPAAEVNRRNPSVRQAQSTDAVATFLSRRFGLAGGLAWLGVLAVGSLGEQVKTRWEVAEQEKGIQDVGTSAQKEIELPSGVRFTDLRIGGGQMPPKGYLAVVHYTARANGEVFEDTYARGKPIVFFFGSRPFTGGMCLGVEQALASMKAGGKRRVVVPAALGFGSTGAVLRPTEHVPDKQGIIPPNAELEYELELVKVSIPPT